HAEAEGLDAAFRELERTGQLIIDEFEKQLAIEKRAREALAEAEQAVHELLNKVRPDDLKSVDAFLSGLTELQRGRGRLASLKELRSVDVARIDALDKELVQRFDAVTEACVRFFIGDDAWKPLLARLEALGVEASQLKKSSELTPLREQLD